MHAAACVKAAVGEEEAAERYDALCERNRAAAQARCDANDLPADAPREVDHEAQLEADDAETEAEHRADTAWSNEFKAWLARSAATLRRFLPYSSTAVTDWRIEGGLVFTGRAMLRLDDWVLRDGVLLADFATLEPDRAVAFDRAQEQAAGPLVTFVEDETPKAGT